MLDKKAVDTDPAEIYGQQWVNQSRYWSTMGYHIRYQNEFIDSLHLGESAKVLECGSGTGEIAKRVIDQYFSKDGPKVDFYLADISTTLLKIVRENLVPPERVRTHLIKASANNLPFKDDFYDQVYALSMLWYTPDPRSAILEMLRILKPGGSLCFDIMSGLNTTGIIGNISNKLSSSLLGRQRVKYLLPRNIDKILHNENVEFDVTGYMPFLPTTIPGLSNHLNLFNAIDWLPNTKNQFFIQFCNKITYRVKKNG